MQVERPISCRFLDFAFYLCLGLIFSACVGASVANQIPTASAPDGAPVRFPQVSVSDLNGQSYELPVGLPSARAVIVMGFAHSQREEVARWAKALTLAVNGKADLMLIEMPVIDGGSAALRSVIRNGMRAGISDEDTRRRTMTLFVNRDEFARTLKLSSVEQPAVVLIARDGAILWKASGALSPEQLAGLSDVLATSHS